MQKIHLLFSLFVALMSYACGNSRAEDSAWEAKYEAARDALDRGDVAEALPALMALREQAAEENDRLKLARSARMFSEMYGDCGANESALALAREAAAIFEESGDSAELTEMRIRLSSMVDENEEKALIMQVLAADSLPEVTRLVAMRKLAYIFYKDGQFSEAEKIYRKINAHYGHDSQDMAYLGLIMLTQDRVAEAVSIDSTLQAPFPVVYKFKKELYMRLGRYDDAIRAMEQADAFRREYYSDIQNKNLIGALADYYEANRRLREKELRQARMILWLVVISAASAALALALMFISYNRKKKQSEEHNLRVVSELQEAYNESESKRLEARARMRKMLRERYRVLDEVCLIAWEHPDDKVARKAISRKMTELIGTLSSGKEEFARLESLVNEHHACLLDKLRASCPNLKEVDYRLYVYTALGFSAGAVALLLGIDKVSIVYDRKRRLRARLQRLPDGASLVDPIS